MKTASSDLDDLLEQEPDRLVANVQERIRAKLEQHSGLLLFGTGQLGKITLQNLRRIGQRPLAFADNNSTLVGSELGGVPILLPADAAAQFPAALFVITVYTNAPVRRQLKGMGRQFITFAELAWCYPETFLPHVGLELPRKIFAEAVNVRAAFHLWADEASRLEYLGQIAWRSSLDPSVLPLHSPAKETYFPSDLFDLAPDEVLVDCGAFDGDSIRSFLRRTGNSFKAAVALEPDPITRLRFEKWRDTLPSGQASRIHLLPYATGERRETLSFHSAGTPTSALGSGWLQVESLPLDESVAQFAPSFIKIDIEGAEPATVQGSRRIMREQKPILAVCLYHAQEHLWQIPLLIKSLNPSYQLFLRRYSDECWELVCYAVPKERCKI